MLRARNADCESKHEYRTHANQKPISIYPPIHPHHSPTHLLTHPSMYVSIYPRRKARHEVKSDHLKERQEHGGNNTKTVPTNTFAVPARQLGSI